MPGIIEALLKLQEVQLEIFELRQEEVSREKRIALHRKELERIETRAAQLDVALRDARSAAALGELEVKTREQNIAKHREALKQTKTNKEYNAILTSLNTEEVDKGKCESRALELIAQADQLRTQREDVEKERLAVLERIRLVEEALAGYQQKTAPQRQALEQRRTAACEGIPAPALITFDRVAERHDGAAMAKVVKIHPKREEYCCGGCHIKVTLEVISSLRSRDDLQFCSACGRIFYAG